MVRSRFAGVALDKASLNERWEVGPSIGSFVLRDDWARVEEAEIADGTEIALGNAKLVFRV